MPDSPLAAPAAALGPEVELLLCCARTCPEAAHAERIRALLQAGIDWEHLLELASRHAMLPLLYWNLNAICPDALPAEVLAGLRELFQANARRNLYLTGELVELLRLLGASGIAALPFRGPVLAATVYGNLALRQFIDLDILVPRRQAAAAKEVFISLGYRPWGEPAAAAAVDWPLPGCEHTLWHDEKRVSVDLHWAIIDRAILRGLNGARMWKRLASVSLAGATVHTLPPEELLLVLCAHAAKHGPTPSGRLAWFCDVAELLAAHPALDWDRVTEQARRLGGQRMLWLGLFLACDLLGAPLPEEIWVTVKADPAVGSLAAQVREHLFAEAEAPHLGAGRYAFYLRMRERLQDRISCLYYLARDRQKLSPSEQDRALLPVPAVLSPLYYLLRPIRLVREYGLRDAIAIWVDKSI